MCPLRDEMIVLKIGLVHPNGRVEDTYSFFCCVGLYQAHLLLEITYHICVSESMQGLACLDVSLVQ